MTPAAEQSCLCGEPKTSYVCLTHKTAENIKSYKALTRESENEQVKIDPLVKVSDFSRVAWSSQVDHDL